MRPWSRKLDYMSIAVSSIALMRSVFPHTGPNRTALALAATPVNPLAVSTASAIAMEVSLHTCSRGLASAVGRRSEVGRSMQLFQDERVDSGGASRSDRSQQAIAA